MAKVIIRWHSVKFWLLTVAAAALVWFKKQLVNSSIIVQLVNEGLQYVIYLMTFHKLQMAAAVAVPKRKLKAGKHKIKKRK